MQRARASEPSLDGTSKSSGSHDSQLTSKMLMLDTARELWFDFMSRFVPHSEPWEEKWHGSPHFEELFHAISFVGHEVGTAHSGKTFTCNINVTCTKAEVEHIIQQNLEQRSRDVHQFVAPGEFDSLFYNGMEFGAQRTTCKETQNAGPEV